MIRMWYENHDGTRTENRTYICPDLLSLDDIGAADNLRGKTIRLFFWLMQVWKV